MNLDKGDGYVLYRRHHSGPHGIRSEGNSGATHQSRPHSLNGSMPPQSVKNRWPACHQPTGGGCQVRLNNMAKYVELTVEGLRTRVRFPPPPPMRKDQPLIRLVFFYLLPRACAGSCRFFRTSIFCIPSRFAHNSLSPRHYSLVPLPIIQVEVRMLVFLFLVNSIDYMRTNQCGLIGELLGEGNTVL